MRRLAIMVLLIALPVMALGSSQGVYLDQANIDLSNQASLQRGAKWFVNYCLSCHSASYMRYSRIAKDLGLSEEQVAENLMFVGDKIGETMTVAMAAEDAKNWFGTNIPDLSVIARVRGPDWLYTYLRTFYLDDSRPFGVNNTTFKDVGMPHVLGELQGWQKPVYKKAEGKSGDAHQVVDEFELVEPGILTPSEYDKAVQDLVAFMAYMGEPVKLERQRLGVWVLLFLAVFFVLAYLLKKEFWKDVH